KLPPMTLANMSWMVLSCLMLLSQVQGEDSQNEQASSARINCPQGALAYDSYCYVFILIPQTWINAELACQRFPSGHLTSVLNSGEARFISSLVKNSVHGYQNVWIGLFDPTHGTIPNGGGWRWSNSDVLTYFNWERNPSTAAYCGSLSRASDYLKWREYNCDSALPYVCKFK
uniref:Regenerating islet-derived 3 delta n=1 Tax=Nannospalax galili TaxID=1026970 RepID=A0A8C6QP24_NANGA